MDEGDVEGERKNEIATTQAASEFPVSVEGGGNLGAQGEKRAQPCACIQTFALPMTTSAPAS